MILGPTTRDLAGRSPGPAGLHAAARSPRALAVYCLVTFGWTWSLWATSILLTLRSPAMGTAVVLAAGFGPSLGALVVVLIFSGLHGLRDWLRRCLAWRFGPNWYGMAFLAPPMTMLMALGLHLALDGTLPASTMTAPLVSIIAQFGLVLIIGGPLGEEFGWRGYLLPVLTAKVGWRCASLGVGALWGTWHIPLFFMAGTGQSQMPMALFLASAVALSIVFARLSINTAFSVIPALLLHWSINGWSLVIPIIPAGGSVRPYALVMGILFVTSLIVFLKPGPKPAIR